MRSLSVRWTSKLALVALALTALVVTPEPRPSGVAMVRSQPQEETRSPGTLGVAIRVALGLLLVTATVVQWKEYAHARE